MTSNYRGTTVPGADNGTKMTQADLTVEQVKTLSTFVPSAHQKTIFDFIQFGRGDGIVSAVAGSGKTTTLVQGARYLKTQNALFVAFNKHIAEALAVKLQGTGMQASTIHSLGLKSVRNYLRGFNRQPDVDDRKYQNLCRVALVGGRFYPTPQGVRGGDVAPSREGLDLAKAALKMAEAPFADHKPLDAWLANEIGLMKKEDAAAAQRLLRDLVDMSRLTLTRDEAGIATMIEERNISTATLQPRVVEAIVKLVRPVINLGIGFAQQTGKIDFTDMIFMPVALKLNVFQYEWIFVDEAQDLNTCQRELVLMARARGGRMLFVGDPAQAIMAFAGADAKSFWLIKERTQATELPLSVCYRCPSSHLEMARTIVPQIEDGPAAIEGTVSHIKEAAVLGNVQEGDLIVCRMKAPLVSLCIKLISNRIPARVRGKDIAKMLTELARSIAGYGSWDQFLGLVEQYQSEQVARLMSKANPSEAAIELVTDTCMALEACYNGFHSASVEEMCAEIDGIFSKDEERASVWLSTVHKAKGLEADRVFILDADRFPYAFKNQNEDQAEQERNLFYVSLTRSRSELFLVQSETGK